MEYVATGFIASGALHVRNRKAFDRAIGSWRDCEVLVTVTKAHAHRSGAQNRYYWGVVVALIAEHTGYTPEETHDALKTMFLPKKVAMLNGNGDVHDELVIGGSTAKLNKVEFGEYMTRIREWALTALDVEIPSPMERDEAA